MVVNIHRTEHDWNEFAQDWGYQHIRDMLYDLYVTKGYSARALGAALGVGRDRATQLLRRHDIKVRSRGGWNRD